MGQIVGTKDLTKLGNQIPEEAGSKADVAIKNESFCDSYQGVADGVEVNPDLPALTISITKAELNTDRKGLSLTTTLQLKNHGIGPILIPWTDHRIPSAAISSEGNFQKFAYILATVDLFFGDAHTTDPMMSLAGEAALWMQPANTEQSIKLDTGQWINVILKADVVCRLADPNDCLDRLRKEPARVSAWWYQRLLTTTMKGNCISLDGAYTQLEIDSHPTSISVNVPDDFKLGKP